MRRISDSEQFISNVKDISVSRSAKTGRRWNLLFTAVVRWWEQRKTQKLLQGLSNEQLKDIGLGRKDIDKLYGAHQDERTFWPHWPK